MSIGIYPAPETYSVLNMVQNGKSRKLIIQNKLAI
jgi:hypothetical protein